MTELNGWIALHRKFLEWGWYSDTNTKVVFLHLLLNASWRDTEWRGIQIKRGQVVTGIKSLSKTLSLSPQQVRTALKHLETTGEITRKSTNRFSVCTICNFNDYQDCENAAQQASNKQATSKQQHLNNITNKQYIDNSIYISEIVDYLNAKSGKKFRATQKIRGLVSSLMESGYTVEDAKKVVDKKCDDWLGTIYEPGLAPKSLFDSDKFDGYLNETKSAKSEDNKRAYAELFALQCKWNEEGLSCEDEQRMHELERICEDGYQTI